MKTLKLASLSLAFGVAVLAGTALDASAQGRRPANAGPPAGTPSGGAGGGLGNAGTRSGGRSDDGLMTASERSNGRSDMGLDRARAGNTNSAGHIPTNNELNRFNGISRKLGVSAETLRASYQAALATNPNLTFGQFVAANVLADNLGATYPLVTADAILAGLADGRSIGSTLRSLGLGKDEADDAKKAAERQIKESKKK
jgi:hypothetical protein